MHTADAIFMSVFAILRLYFLILSLNDFAFLLLPHQMHWIMGMRCGRIPKENYINKPIYETNLLWLYLFGTDADRRLLQRRQPVAVQ